MATKTITPDELYSSLKLEIGTSKIRSIQDIREYLSEAKILASEREILDLLTNMIKDGTLFLNFDHKGWYLERSPRYAYDPFERMSLKQDLEDKDKDYPYEDWFKEVYK